LKEKGDVKNRYGTDGEKDWLMKQRGCKKTLQKTPKKKRKRRGGERGQTCVDKRGVPKRGQYFAVEGGKRERIWEKDENSASQSFKTW